MLFSLINFFNNNDNNNEDTRIIESKRLGMERERNRNRFSSRNRNFFKTN